MDPNANNYQPVEAGSTVRIMWWLIFLISLSIIAYWPLHFLGFVPAELLHLPGSLVRANIALDTMFIAAGLFGYIAWRSHKRTWQPVAIISLCFSMATGLVNFSWFVATDNWPALALSVVFCLYPLLFLRHLVRKWRRQATTGH